MTTRTDGHDLQRALDMERRILGRAAERAENHRLGTALHDEARPRVWTHNQLHVTEPVRDGDELVGALDELYGDLLHRRGIVEDAVEGERLAPDFRERGWLVNRFVYMALRAPRDREPDRAAAREVSEAELHEVERAQLAQAPFGKDPPVLAQLLDARAAAHRAAQGCRYVVGCAGDELAGTATLYLDGGLAQVEDVGTLEAFRGRGIARAMVCLAIDLAADAEMVWLPADDDDWPKQLYEKLGFRPIGTIWAFTRVGPEHPAYRPDAAIPGART